MAFCPNCESEYRAGISACPDCEIDLVPELTRENKVHDKSDIEFVKFRSCANSAEAEMVLELLERNGIRSFARPGEIGIFGTSFHGGAVMVDARDFARAAEIYEAYFDAEATEEEEQEDQGDDE